jgi:hypothetical protein
MRALRQRTLDRREIVVIERDGQGAQRLIEALSRPCADHNYVSVTRMNMN